MRKTKNSYWSQKGFTLIELLVVIAIIGILATIVLVSLNTARQKARDARRASDIRQVGLALEMYYDSQSPVAYPTAAVSTVGIPATVKTALANYMAIVPDDPLGATRGYAWLGNVGDTARYCIYAQEETDNTKYFLASNSASGRRNAVPTLATCVPNL